MGWSTRPRVVPQEAVTPSAPASVTPVTPELQRTLELAPSMLAYWDRDLRCRFANRAYEQWFGVALESLPGTWLPDLLGPALYALNRCYIDGALAGRPQHFERTLVDRDGVRRESLACYLPDLRDGTVHGFAVQVTDVTHLKRIEASLAHELRERQRILDRLAATEQALRHAQRLARIGSWEWEAATDIGTWSDELYRIFGLDPARIPPGRAWQAERYAPDSWRRLQDAIERALAHGESYHLFLEALPATGGRCWLEAFGEPWHDDTGAVAGLRGTIRLMDPLAGLHPAPLPAATRMRDPLQRITMLVHALSRRLEPGLAATWVGAIQQATDEVATLLAEAEAQAGSRPPGP